mgnify:CR=1 FL=1
MRDALKFDPRRPEDQKICLLGMVEKQVIVSRSEWGKHARKSIPHNIGSNVLKFPMFALFGTKQVIAKPT